MKVAGRKDKWKVKVWTWTITPKISGLAEHVPVFFPEIPSPFPSLFSMFFE